jgi:predicted ATP-dependent serine protease
LLSPGECADAPSRGYIIKGFVAPGDVGCIFGAPGAGKSLISPHLGYAVAQGRGAFGMRTKAGRVFYVAAEDPHGMRGRVSALKLRHGDADDFTLVEGVSDLLAKGSPDFTALLAAVAEHKPSLIFIDTLAMAFPGLEENSAEDMGRVVALARRLTAHGAAVVLIHHDTKAGTPTPRGHSLLNGALDMALQLFARDETGIVRGSSRRTATARAIVTSRSASPPNTWAMMRTATRSPLRLSMSWRRAPAHHGRSSARANAQP